MLQSDGTLKSTNQGNTTSSTSNLGSNEKKLLTDYVNNSKNPLNYMQKNDAEYGLKKLGYNEKEIKSLAKTFKSELEKEEEKKKEVETTSFFKKGAFGRDDIGAVEKGVLGVGSTALDVTTNVVRGILTPIEGLFDFTRHGIADVTEALGFEETAQEVRDIANESDMDKIFGWTDDYFNRNSMLGQRSESVSQGLGQVGSMLLPSGIGSAVGLGTKGITALTTAYTGLSSAGSGRSEAYLEGATDEESRVYGLISGVADAGTELIFGGLGKSINAMGYATGISSADDMVAKKTSDVLKSTLMKNIKISDKALTIAGNTVELGVKSGAEGVEEVLAGFISALGKKATYMSEEELSEILEDENLAEQFVVGALTSGIAQSGVVPGMKQGSYMDANKKGQDLVTGYTKNEQKVVDQIVNEKIQELETDEKKLTTKEKNAIKQEVETMVERGELDLDTIEKTLAGDSYKEYENLVKESEEFEQLRKMKNGDRTDIQNDRLAELKAKNKEKSYQDLIKESKQTISQNVREMTLNDSRLQNSYLERSKRGESYQVDTSKKYSKEEMKIVQKAVDSGIINNTRKAHEMVDLVAKLSADQKMDFDFTNNEKLKESGFAIEGVTINGFKQGDKITINMQSKNALNSVVGHEITHVLEGTDLYKTLQDSVIEYAKQKGVYDAKYKEVVHLYRKQFQDNNLENRKALYDSEITADLVGEYIFNDIDFVKNLSTTDRNLFQKIYDEIKYFLKQVTAGSDAEKQLLKAKKIFEDVYKESSKTTKDSNGKKTQYSLQDTKGNRLTSSQVDFFKDSKIRDVKGDLRIAYHFTDSEFTVFDKNKIGSGNGGYNFGKGFYFSTDEEMASDYGNTKGEYYLNIKNPYRYYSTDKEYIVDMLEKSGIEYDKEFVEKYDFDELEDVDLIDDFLSKVLKDKNPYEEFSNMVKSAGYDGIWAGDEIVAFEPNQIKSVENSKPTADPDIRFSFSGENALNKNNEQLLKAKTMSEQGESSELIRQETGWHQGYDGKWRFEIDDSQMEVYKGGDALFRKNHPEYAKYQDLYDKFWTSELTEEENAEFEKLDDIWGHEYGRLYKRLEDGNAKLKDILQHDVLFANYPMLADINVKIENLERDGLRGYFSADRNKIALDKSLFKSEYRTNTRDEVLIHEIQHAIQFLEDFARGSSPEFYDSQRKELSNWVRGVRENLDLYLKDINYKEYQNKTLNEIMENAISQGKKWADVKQDYYDALDEYKRNSKYGEEIANIEKQLNDLMKQFDERFGKISDNLDSYDLYQNTAGEIEARDTAERLRKTAEERKEIAPVSRLENVEKDKVVFAEDYRYSLSKETKQIDNDYMKAVENEDTETAQNMVDEVANKNGYTKRMFHETNAENIHIFDISRGTHGGNDSETPYGIFTKSSDKNIGLGKKQMALYVKADNTLHVKDRTEVRNKIPQLIPYYDQIAEIDRKYDALAEELEDVELEALSEWMEANPEVDMDEVYPDSFIIEGKPAIIDDEKYQSAFKERQDIMTKWRSETDAVSVKCKEIITKHLRDNGYDSMYFMVDGGSFGRQTDSLIVLDSNQVKSANPVTRDDNGNVIPLSQRFNANTSDIRYSLSNKDQAPVKGGIYSEDVLIDGSQKIGLKDIAPIGRGGRISASMPKPLEGDGVVRGVRIKGNNVQSEHDEIAKILSEEPKTESQRNKRKWAIFKANVLDKGAVFEDLSLKNKNRELMGKWDYTLTSGARAQYLIGNGDKKTNVKSLNSIRETVGESGLTQQFYDYMYHKHNVDRMNLEERFEGVENKPVFGYGVTSGMSQIKANDYELKYPQFKKWAKDVYSYQRYLRQQLVDNGVIAQETADLWEQMYPHYVPIRRVDENGNAINVPLDTRKTGINAPIKRATGGNADILPLFDTMAMRTQQTYRATAKNSFGVELKNTLGSVVETSQTNIDEVIESVSSQESLLQEGMYGANPTFTVFENGEKTTFEITKDMYDALKPLDESSLLSKTFTPLNKLSNLHRNLLTQYNPVFTFTNAIKDVQDVMLNSQHAVKTYSKVPEALVQIAGKGYWYEEYMRNGGEQNSYFDSETNTFKTEDKALQKLLSKPPFNTISAMNNYVELVPRLSEYIASREMGRSIEVSMLDSARVTTNFKAGGDLTKFLNRNGATFLNASVQGAMQQVRNVREAKANGVKGWMNLATKFALAGLPAIILNNLVWDDDEEYEELSDYVKQNYYVVYKTDDGQFYRIPKGRTMAVIQDAIQQVSNFATGNDEVDLASFLDLAVSNLAPNNPIENNILSPIIQVMNNKTWYGEDLVPTRLQDLPASEQYDESTDRFSKWVGETFDISPVKVNYLLDQYSGGIGDVALPMMTPEAEHGEEGILGNFIAPLKDKFITDSTLNNQNISDFYDLRDELTTNAKKQNATNEEILMDKYLSSINSEMIDLYTEKREIQNSNLSNSEKYDAVKEVQRQIVELAKEGLSNYKNVFVEGSYASVGDRQYMWYQKEGEDEGSWKKLSEKQLAKQTEVTNALGITPSSYWGNKEEYDFAYEYPDKYVVAKVVGGYETYLGFDEYLDDIRADKDANGKTISGSAKEKKIQYINGLNLDYGQKIILFRSLYGSKSDKEKYNYDIIEYLNNREDISYEEMVTILEGLEMKIDSNGNVYW